MANEAKVNFTENLKSRRLSMGAGNRKRTENPTLPSWLYPYAIERRYKKLLKENVVIPMTSIATRNLQVNLGRWISERTDYAEMISVDSKKDITILEGQSYLKLDDDFIYDDAESGIESPLNSRILFLDNSYYLKLDDWIDELRQLANSLGLEIQNIFGVEGETPEKSAIWPILTAIGMDAFLFNGKQWKKQTTKILGFDYTTTEDWWGNARKAWADENYNHLHRYSNDYRRQLQEVVSRGMRQGKLLRDIMKDVDGLSEKFINKTELLARDQIGKLNGKITELRQQEIGLTEYEWITVKDERVRAKHKVMDGKIMSWNNSTIYANKSDIKKTKSGVKISWKSRTSSMDIGVIPGEAIQCRCQALPFWDPLIQEVDSPL